MRTEEIPDVENGGGELVVGGGVDVVVAAAIKLFNPDAKHPPCLMLYADNDLPTLKVMAEQMCKS
jgi:hypothetical protein